MIVLFQRVDNKGDYDILQEPLEIPDKLPDEPIKFNFNYLDEPAIKLIPIKFKNYPHPEVSDYLQASSEFTRIWALASNLVNADVNSQ